MMPGNLYFCKVPNPADYPVDEVFMPHLTEVRFFTEKICVVNK